VMTKALKMTWITLAAMKVRNDRRRLSNKLMAVRKEGVL
jgi:hypothetical protein